MSRGLGDVYKRQNKYITVEDKWLTDNGLDEGSVWPEDTDE
mgnify:CR=1 FL=1